MPVDKAGTLPRPGSRPKSKGSAYITFKSEVLKPSPVTTHGRQTVCRAA